MLTNAFDKEVLNQFQTVNNKIFKTLNYVMINYIIENNIKFKINTKLNVKYIMLFLFFMLFPNLFFIWIIIFLGSIPSLLPN